MKATIGTKNAKKDRLVWNEDAMNQKKAFRNMESFNFFVIIKRLVFKLKD